MLPRDLAVDDATLDALADAHLTGGYIRNAVLRAGFRAAAHGRAIGPDDLLEAAALELRAQGRVVVQGSGRLSRTSR
jgi:hypothetical protein